MKRIDALAGEERTMVFYESPGRTLRTLKEMQEVLGDREAALARELTKIHETVVRGRLSDIIEIVEEKGVRGEVVLIVSGGEGLEKGPTPDRHALIEAALKKGLSSKEAAAEVAKSAGISRREAYQYIIEMKKGGK